jgi:hypothetical protein
MSSTRHACPRGVDDEGGTDVTHTLWFVGSDSMGGESDLGGRLMQMFFNSLVDRVTEPGTFAFVNRGVYLTLDDSPVLDALRELAARGSRFLSCGTCLDYYQVRERLGVGEVGSMPLLEEQMLAADKVISL